MSIGTVAVPDTAESLPAWECWPAWTARPWAGLRHIAPPVVLSGVDRADFRAQIVGHIPMQLL